MLLKNVGAEFLGASEEELIEQTAFDGDLAAPRERAGRSGSEWHAQYAAPEVDKFHGFEDGMGEPQDACAEAESIQDWPARRVEAIAADLFPWENGAFEEGGFEAGLGTKSGTGGTGGACANDDDIKKHD